MPSSAGREHSVFLKAGFTGLGDTFQIHPHQDPGWETLQCLSSLTCRITGKVATRKPADLAPSQGWWAPPTWRHTAAGDGTLTGRRAWGWDNTILVEGSPGDPESGVYSLVAVLGLRMGLVAPRHVGLSQLRDGTVSPALAGGFSTTEPPGKPLTSV